jgi:hypothetical protein
MNKNTPKAKGVRTALQTIAGALVSYITGLLALPAVRDYTNNFVHTQGVAALGGVLLALGVGAGIVAFVQNKLEDK